MNAPALLPRLRQKYQPKLPKVLEALTGLKAAEATEGAQPNVGEELLKSFPQTRHQAALQFVQAQSKTQPEPARKVGVVFSGGQASGGHNVIAGLFDALRKLNSDSRLIGFLDGPEGIISNKTLELTAPLLEAYRNQGGFDLIGSGRTKIETEEQFQAVEANVRQHQLDGLLIIGGDDSNTNGALLAEYFVAKNCPTAVVGVPKTIDGDLKNRDIECSFGFDTACKTYSEIIGNLLRDSLSAKKYTFFIKLMGRSASHIALECALQTHANLTLIGEEIEAQGMTLNAITQMIADLIVARSAQGKNYGAILIPEGVIEFIPEVKTLIQELNKLLSAGQLSLDEIKSQLTPSSAQCLASMPEVIQAQLIMERDPHGNVQVTKIETERLFIETVQRELAQRKAQGAYSGKFSPQSLFCGYEGRCGLPSNFDAHYGYALGHVAALLIAAKATGYMGLVKQLHLPVGEWEIAGAPLVQMMDLEMRKGQMKPVIRKALVDLNGKPFRHFQAQREAWRLNDDYSYPGPIQFFGPEELTEATPLTLMLEHS